ncbi:hypothetical protein AK812_SmicGene29140 [Symbiodinium microadriaticum]|uniref:Peptidase A2 domain-containing protein n=1 Tax=Symbiodinium microadriaticum TaxID=2951 RepID=A0A1Q9D2P0_SYMMI|nr:hypothetical protein AK812_SmicGene29140 [Symbiodinium microadriaticum]
MGSKRTAQAQERRSLSICERQSEELRARLVKLHSKDSSAVVGSEDALKKIMLTLEAKGRRLLLQKQAFLPTEAETRRPSHLHADFLGRGYDLLKLVGGDEVELNFMLDTGLTTSILSPGRAQELGVERPSRQARREVPTVILEDLRLREGLPIGSLRPFIMDFPQQRGAPKALGAHPHARGTLD